MYAPKSPAQVGPDLKHAAEILIAYCEPHNENIDNGNLFYAATEYQRAYLEVVKERDEILSRMATKHCDHMAQIVKLSEQVAEFNTEINNLRHTIAGLEGIIEDAEEKIASVVKERDAAEMERLKQQIEPVMGKCLNCDAEFELSNAACVDLIRKRDQALESARVLATKLLDVSECGIMCEGELERALEDTQAAAAIRAEEHRKCRAENERLQAEVAMVREFDQAKHEALTAAREQIAEMEGKLGWKQIGATLQPDQKAVEQLHIERDAALAEVERLKRWKHECEEGNRVCMGCGAKGDDVAKLQYGYKCKCGCNWTSTDQIAERERDRALERIARLERALKQIIKPQYGGCEQVLLEDAEALDQIGEIAREALKKP